MITFNEYMKAQHVHFLVRHFIRDAVLDEDFPKVTSWKQLENYLLKCNAAHEAFVGAKMTWRAYLKEFG